MAATMQDDTVHLEDLITYLYAAGSEGGTGWVDTADEDCHAVTVLVPGEAQAQALPDASLQLHHQDARAQVCIFFLYFIYTTKQYKHHIIIR